MATFSQKAVVTSIDGSVTVTPRVNGGWDLSAAGGGGGGSGGEVQDDYTYITLTSLTISGSSATLLGSSTQSFSWVQNDVYQISIPFYIAMNAPASAGWLNLFCSGVDTTGSIQYFISQSESVYLPATMAGGGGFIWTGTLKGTFKALNTGSSQIKIWASIPAVGGVGTTTVQSTFIGTLAGNSTIYGPTYPQDTTPLVQLTLIG